MRELRVKDISFLKKSADNGATFVAVQRLTQALQRCRLGLLPTGLAASPQQQNVSEGGGGDGALTFAGNPHPLQGIRSCAAPCALSEMSNRSKAGPSEIRRRDS